MMQAVLPRPALFRLLGLPGRGACCATVSAPTPWVRTSNGVLGEPSGSQFFQGTSILLHNHELLAAWGRPNKHAEVYELLHVWSQWVVPPQMDASVVNEQRKQGVCQVAVIRRTGKHVDNVIGAHPPER